MEDPGDPHAWHHTPADRSLLDVSDIGPIVVKHVRGLAAHWPEGEAPEVITPLGRHLRFDGVRRWLREEGANAPEEVRRMATDVMASFGVLE